MLYADKRALFQHGFHQLASARRAMLQRMDHRHCDLAFTQIACHRLAQHFF